MDSIAINNKNYVNADYVLKNAPIYSKGVRSSRDLIRKKNINCDNFIYSKFENNAWIVSNGKSVKFDKVFILENYVKTIPEINKNIEIIKKPDTITINEIEYVNCDYVLENAPVFSKGSKNSRMLLKNKNIEPSNFIYVRFENDKWNITDGKSIKFDKIFISKSYMDSIPELKQNNENEIIINENGIEKAPEIIILEDNEKLKDNEGNVLDIEVRGIREVDKIYFKVKDVEKGFGMHYLNDSLKCNENNYFLKQHYEYFLCENKSSCLTNNKERVIKTLFLTFHGFMRLIFVSKKINHLNSINVCSWLNYNFNDNRKNDFSIMLNDKEKQKEGFVYCVSAKTINHIKIGFWRGDKQSLKKRYSTITDTI